MAAKSGKSGTASFGAAAEYDAKFRAWTLDVTQAALDVTTFEDSGLRVVVPGISQWSGSGEGFVDASTDVDLITALVSVTLDDSQVTTFGQVRYTGNAIITSISYGSAADGTATVSVTFDGSGALVTTGA
jgi:predicted secreted protein